MKLQLMEHQVPFVTNTTHRFVGFVGGYGTGKSVSMCNRGLMNAKRNPGCLGALMEPVFSMVDTDLKPTWENILDESGIRWEYESKSYLIYKLHFPGQRPSRVQLMSAENHQRLRGKNLAWWIVDEFDTIAPMSLQKLVLEQLLARLRAGHSEATESGAFVSTPEGFKTMYEFFVKDPEIQRVRAEEDGEEYVSDRILYRAKSKENYLLKPSYFKSLEAQYPPQLLRAYLDGEFVNMTTGNVYYNFDKEANATDLTAEWFLSRGYTPHFSCDFNNFKRGGGSGLVSFIMDNSIYYVAEFMRTRKTHETCEMFRTRYGDVYTICHPDKSGGAESANSEKSNFQILQDYGFEVMEQDNLGSRMNPDIIDNVNCVNGRILNGAGERHVFINPKTCPITFDAVLTQPFNDQGMPLKDGKVDGPMDAFRYPIWNIWGRGKHHRYATGSVNG